MYYCALSLGVYCSIYSPDFLSRAQGSSLTFSLAGQSGQPKSGLAGPQLVWLARDTFIGLVSR